jgi:hypothetical protein
VDLVR